MPAATRPGQGAWVRPSSPSQSAAKPHPCWRAGFAAPPAAGATRGRTVGGDEEWVRARATTPFSVGNAMLLCCVRVGCTLFHAVAVVYRCGAVCSVLLLCCLRCSLFHAVRATLHWQRLAVRSDNTAYAMCGLSKLRVPRGSHPVRAAGACPPAHPTAGNATLSLCMESRRLAPVVVCLVFLVWFGFLRGGGRGWIGAARKLFWR
jgi:hypothetical protein